MRAILSSLAIFGLGLGLGACSNDVMPRVIAGGGVGDGAIDGELNVYVIDNETDAPIADATVEVGKVSDTTDSNGLVVFQDVSGKQTVTVKATGYRSAVWVGVNGANVTIPVTVTGIAPDQATLTGSIAGWDGTTGVLPGHLKAAAVFYSQSDLLGDKANNIKTPLDGNVCTGVTMCNWTLASRTGTLTLVAAIIDYDSKNTATKDDDTTTVIGWATKTSVTVAAGVNQSGLVLNQLTGADTEAVNLDLGTPPTTLPELGALIGIELSKDEVIQLPAFQKPLPTSLQVPKRSLFNADATYRLTAVAQTTTGDMGAQAIVLRQGLTSTDLAAGEWLEPPTGVVMNRTHAEMDPIAGASVHQAAWKDATDDTILEITTFDGTTSIDIPALVSLPTSGVLTGRASGLGADFKLTDFSLDRDRDLLWGIAAATPVTIN
jgi:hypothetical protein